MRRIILAALSLLSLSFFVCAQPAPAAGPEDALTSVAAALRAKDVKAFRDHVDVDGLFDATYAKSYEPSGSVPILPFRQRSIDDFLEGIASGTYAKQCTEARRPGCPWYPDGLDRAKITVTDSTSALAAIDSKEDIRTWVVLHKTDAGWRIIAAPPRLKDAELYASEAFQIKLRLYRQAIVDKYAEEAEQERKYAEGAAKAAGRARAILAKVAVGNLRFSFGTGVNENYCTINMTVTNNFTEELRLWSVAMTVRDGSGKIVAEKEYRDTTPYIQPGQSALFSVATTARQEEEYTMFKELARGTYTASAKATYVLVGKRNLHIDMDGGGLKPSR